MPSRTSVTWLSRTTRFDASKRWIPLPRSDWRTPSRPLIAVAHDLYAVGLVDPDAERAVLEDVVLQHRARRRRLDVDARIRGTDVRAAAPDRDTLDPGAGSADAQRRSLITAIDHAPPAAQDHRPIDEDRSHEAAGPEFEDVARMRPFERRREGARRRFDAHDGGRNGARRQDEPDASDEPLRKQRDPGAAVPAPRVALHTSRSSMRRRTIFSSSWGVRISLPSRRAIPTSGGQT